MAMFWIFQLMVLMLLLIKALVSNEVSSDMDINNDENVNVIDLLITERMVNAESE